MSKKNLKIRLSHNKWLHAISSAVFLLEEPALSERLGVDQSRAVLHLLVLGSDGARDRAVDLAGRLNRELCLTGIISTNQSTVSGLIWTNERSPL